MDKPMPGNVETIRSWEARAKQSIEQGRWESLEGQFFEWLDSLGPLGGLPKDEREACWFLLHNVAWALYENRVPTSAWRVLEHLQPPSGPLTSDPEKRYPWVDGDPIGHRAFLLDWLVLVVGYATSHFDAATKAYERVLLSQLRGPRLHQIGIAAILKQGRKATAKAAYERAHALLVKEHYLAEAGDLELFWQQVEAGQRSKPDEPQQEPQNSFLRRGDLWHIRYKGQAIPPVQHSVGLPMIAALVNPPRRRVPVRLLHDLKAGAPTGSGLIEQNGGAFSVPAHFGTSRHFDRKTLKAVNERIRVIEMDLRQAVDAGDKEEADRLRKVLSTAKAGIAEMRGFNSSSPELRRARMSVTQAIQRSIKQLNKVSEEVALHLRENIRTGAYCSYEPSQDIEWRT